MVVVVVVVVVVVFVVVVVVVVAVNADFLLFSFLSHSFLLAKQLTAWCESMGRNSASQRAEIFGQMREKRKNEKKNIRGSSGERGTGIVSSAWSWRVPRVRN